MQTCNYRIELHIFNSVSTLQPCIQKLKKAGSKKEADVFFLKKKHWFGFKTSKGYIIKLTSFIVALELTDPF